MVRDRPTLVANRPALIGDRFVIEAPSPSTSFLAVFEDDGRSGFFYGLDRDLPEPMLDALHVYEVEAFRDRGSARRFQVLWSADGLKVALYIDGVPMAAFDFEARRGYCRDGFPPPAPGFSAEGHDWDDDVLKHFG